MFRKCQVIMLPTDEKVKKVGLYLYSKNKKLELHYYNQSLYKEEPKRHHLYITSDDEIKEGDWVYHISGYISQVLGFNLDAVKLKDAQRWLKDCKKIISTTDSSLWEHDDTVPYPKTRPALPRPSNPFIKKYVEEYNKGNAIIDVMVEYVEYYSRQFFSGKGYRESDNELRVRSGVFFPKIDPKDSTITVEVLKEESYSREDLLSVFDWLAEMDYLTDDSKILKEEFLEQLLCLKDIR